MRRTIAVFLLAAALAGSLRAETPQASGKFSGKNWEFNASGAYAYPAKVGFDDEPGIRVAVSNVAFGSAVIDRYWDREHVISERFADEKTLVVTFQFGKDGSYKGMSYYFGSGDGCGFCMDSAVKSTVKVSGGRVKGKIARAAEKDEASWDLELDVPVAPSDYGTPLPAGGGEVGAVYAAYHQALADGDAVALGKIFRKDVAARLADQKDRVIEVWEKDHPTKSYRVIKGFQRGDRALLLVEGETPYFAVTVEALFLKEDGGWRLDDEISQVKSGSD